MQRIYTPGPSGDEIVAEAGRLLRAGELIAHPTDTVYGLAALATSPAAVARLNALKGRPGDQPILCLIDEPLRLDALVHSMRRYVVDYVAKYWPGPLTLILEGVPGAAARSADGSVALRCPDHALTRRLIREAAGLLASTSANKTGGPVAGNAAGAIALFGPPPGGLALALDETPGDTPHPLSPSTVVDCRGEKPRIVREGAIPASVLGL